MRTPWLIAEPEPYDEYDLGPLKTGKEAEVFLVERVAADGRSCLLAHKRYRPRTVAHKGELQALGFQRAANFVNDRAYRDGRSIGNSRDRRAGGQAHAPRQDGAPAGLARQRVRDAGAPRGRRRHGAVPGRTHGRRRPHAVHRRPRDGGTAAGPRRTSSRDAERAAALLVENLQRMAEAGVVHADLSVYNLLWWEDGLWIIDVPQAVDITTNSQAFDFLHRDLTNVAGWFRARGVAFDPEQLFGELVATAARIELSGPPARAAAWRVRSYAVGTYGRAAGTCAGSFGRTGRRPVARDRSRLRAADGARAAAVPDRAAAVRVRRSRRRRPRGRLLHRAARQRRLPLRRARAGEVVR